MAEFRIVCLRSIPRPRGRTKLRIAAKPHLFAAEGLRVPACGWWHSCRAVVCLRRIAAASAVVGASLIARPAALFALPSSDTPEARLAFLRPQLEERLTRQDAELKAPQPAPVTRNLGNGALTALVLGKDPVIAETFLRRLFALQNNEASSPDFGIVPWQEGHPEINDANAVEFSAEGLGPIWIGYGDRLSPEFRREAEPHLRAFLAALRHRVMRTPAYTNIYLMRVVDLILIGEAVGDDDAAGYGYSELDRWINYTRQAGIHEFDSPTYTAVDLNSLGLGYRYARRPGARETFRKLLDLFWEDVCANYFPGRGSLSGPHSRDYDFVGGTGGLAYYYRAVGLADDGKPDMLDFEKVYPLLNVLPGGYRPAPEILALVRRSERVVVSRWDTGRSADRTNYVTPDFAVGSASGDYGPQDKMLAVELSASDRSKFPVVSLMPNENDDPYGAKKSLDRSGHSKPHHLPLGLAAVQEKGTVLALLSVPVPAGAPDFTVSLLIPSAADDIAVGGASAAAAAHGGAPFTLPAKGDDVVGVRAGRGAVALRLFALEGEDAAALRGAALQLVGDADGLKRGAVRLVVRPAAGTAFPGGRFRAGLVLQCTRCDDVAAFRQLQDRIAQAAVREDGGPAARTVTVRIGPSQTLAIRRERAGKERILSRSVDGTEVPPTPALLVDGIDYGARLPAAKTAP